MYSSQTDPNNISNNAINSAQTIIDIKHLCRQFNHQSVLNDVSIQVRTGQVVGIVGENGAGKTTLMKHMLGQYRAQQGSVLMFGEDPVISPEIVLSKIGYLSEQPELPVWMTISELLNYTASFYPHWDDDYVSELIRNFNLDINQRINNLSKGQKSRVGLVLAQAYRPELLLLDEPSSGLDPNVRRDILSAIIKTVSDQGRTVVFSSHLLDEIERVCDHLVMLNKGQVLLYDSMENILSKHHRLVIKNDSQLSAHWFQSVKHIYQVKKNGKEWWVDFYGDLNDIKTTMENKKIVILSERFLSLNEVFLSRVSANKGQSL